ncbi:MAG: ribbon-helix-helix protein, CopG family [Patescibacteria group bacterium]
MPERKKGAKTRLQLVFQDSMVERIDRLREDTDAPTRTEVVRRAVKLYEWFADMEKRGYKILARKSTGDKIDEEVSVLIV